MRIPGSTYRWQFNAGFTFQQARALVDYLDDLGITDCYTSPVFTAPPDSNHGYDVCDYNQFNPVIGSSAEWKEFTDALQAKKMGLLLDFVPNHMGASPKWNPWWRDVLENGIGSKYANFFDIDWRSVDPGVRGKIMLPILEDHYGKVLESGFLKVVEQEGKLQLAYRELILPLTPASVAGKKQDDFSRDRLHELLEKQHYRLAYWRTGTRLANYRRFFDVDGLAAVSMERPEVFQSVHRLLSECVRTGRVTGVRLDHIDGLANPAEYLKKLQNLLSPEKRDFYVLVEKITTHDEQLLADWPVAGTTGYDFGAAVTGLLVDVNQERNFSRLYQTLAPTVPEFSQCIHQSKKLVMTLALSREVEMLGRLLLDCARTQPAARDIYPADLTAAVAAFIECFPVYRTYIEPEKLVSAIDQKIIRDVAANARALHPKIDLLAFFFLEETLLTGQSVERNVFCQRFQQCTGPIMAKGFEDTTFFIYNRLIALNEVGGDPGRFGLSPEQFHAFNLTRLKVAPATLSATSTHDTKLSEDARARLIALSQWPTAWVDFLQGAFNSNASHKTFVKRSAVPGPAEEYLFYQILLATWPLEPLTEESRKTYADRVQRHMLKTAREAKIHTRWDAQEAEWEKALTDFITATILHPRPGFLERFIPLAERIAQAGMVNSLAQTLLKLTAPGVPDIYQGNELWQFLMTDPDNRGRVDYEQRRQMLACTKTQNAAALFRGWRNGAIKMFLTRVVLRFRRSHRALFDKGSYEPLEFSGKNKAHCFGFIRRLDDQYALTIVPRLTASFSFPPVGEVWNSTFLHLPPGLGPLKDEMTGAEFSEDVIPINRLLQEVPFALLRHRDENKSK